MCLYETLDIISRHTPAIDWSKEAKRASEVIRISPTSATIACSMKGKIIEALHDPATEVCIIPECLLDSLVGNKLKASMPLIRVLVINDNGLWINDFI